MKRTMALVATLLLGAAPIAEASHNEYSASDKKISRRDPRGDVSNRLDLVRVGFKGHSNGTATLMLRTDKAFGCGYVNRDVVHDGGVASLRWQMDKNKDPYTERTSFFNCSEGRWTLQWGNKSLQARRPDQRTLKVRIPLEKFGLDGRKHLEFEALSFANGKFGDHVYVEETDASPSLRPAGSE